MHEHTHTQTRMHAHTHTLCCFQVLQHTVCCFQAVYSMLYVVFRLCSACCMLFSGCVQHAVYCFLQALYNMLYVFSRLCTACCMFSPGSVQHAVCVCFFQALYSNMRIAVIGQSLFGAEVFRLLQKNGHEVVGVFTIPDVNGKADPLGKHPSVRMLLSVSVSVCRNDCLFQCNCLPISLLSV